MARILDIENKFYPLLVRFLEDMSLAPTIAMDEAEAAYELFMSGHMGWKSRKAGDTYADGEIGGKQAKALQPAVAAYMQESRGTLLAQWILALPGDLVPEVVRIVLSEIVLDDEFASYDRLKILIVYWAAHKLRR
jgi:hypothetical protein